MTIADRRIGSSMELPSHPEVFDGVTVLCAERGVDYFTPWTSCGGQWIAQGPSYVGVWSGVPAASKVRIGCRVIVDETAPAGLTRAPAAGVKMNRLELECRYLPDGATKAWRPRGDQLLFQLGGAPGNPAIAAFTAVAAAGIIGEFGQIPAGLLNQPGMELYARAMIGRGATAAGTASISMTLTPTPGVAGTAFAAIAALTANANAIGWIEGSMFVRTSASQGCTYTLTPNGVGTTAATGAPMTQDLTVAQTLALAFSSGTIGDIFTGLAVSVGVR